jgi:carboxymethylenebutenolidase
MGEMITLTGGGEDFPAYLAKPKGKVNGGIIVIHEVWALNEHTKDIADRFAREGYIALAPNLLTDLNIIEEKGRQLSQDLFNPKTRNEAQPKIRELTAPIHTPDFARKTLAKVKGCFDKLNDMPDVRQRVAIIGYCFGGSYSFLLAINEPRLKVALPFYGHVTDNVDELKKIKCPVRAFYGENDENLMSSLPQLKESMKAAGVDFEAKVYAGTGHAFFNDTNPYAYNEASAKDAWTRVLEILKSYTV